MLNIIKNASLLSVSTLISKLGVLLLIPMLTSALSTADFGQLMTTISLASFIALFVINGQNSAVFRRLTLWDAVWDYRVYEKAVLGCCLAALFIVLLMSVLVNFVFPIEFLFNVPFFLFLLFLFAIAGMSLIDVAMIKWIINKQFNRIIYVALIKAGAILLFTAVLIQANLLVYARAYAESIVVLFGLIVLGYFYWRKFPRIGTVPSTLLLDELKQSFVYGWHIQISQLSILILSVFDRLMLNKLISSEAAGIYTIVMLGLFPMFVVANANNVISVQYNSIYRQAGLHVDLDKLIAKFLLLGVGITLLMKFVLILVGEFLVMLVAGETYVEAAIYLPWVPDILLFYFTYLMATRYFHAKGDSKFILLTTIAAAVANVLLNIILIPRYGVIGALSSSILSYLFISIIAIAGLAFRTSLHQHHRFIVVALGMLVAMGFFDLILLTFMP